MSVPHGDDHELWVDPHDPRRMISGNDGGATISFDGGATWSFDHGSADRAVLSRHHRQSVGRIGSTARSRTTRRFRFASRSDDGVITTDDWYPVGGGESGYIAPKPTDPNVVFAGHVHGDDDALRRCARSSRRDVSVSLNNYDGWAARDVPNRFPWTYPIVFSTHDPNVLYTEFSEGLSDDERGAELGSRSAAISPFTIRRRSAPRAVRSRTT